jgi:hypothetical protein
VSIPVTQAQIRRPEGGTPRPSVRLVLLPVNGCGASARISNPGPNEARGVPS